MNEPELSVVATTRNDNHGGDLTRRTQLFLDGLAAQALRHELPVELIVVEWNPPAERPSLRDELRWPEASRFFGARIVTVPPAEHARFDPQGGLPLFQMIAKNVGIRRARGRFVLATNVDILFPDALFRAMKQLEPGRVYRSDRLDVAREIPQGSFDALLQYCRDHVIRRHVARGTLVESGGRWRNTSPSAYDVCGRALRGWIMGLVPWVTGLVPFGEKGLRAAAHVVLAPFLRPRARRDAFFDRLAAALAARRRLRRVLRALLAGSCGPVFVLAHYLKTRGAAGSRPAAPPPFPNLARIFRVNQTFVRLHTNGCGDFTLLDRASWFRLRGYPEWPVFSWAIDSVFLFQADANRVPNVQFPAEQCTYHVDHGGGWTPEDQANLFSRLAARGIPMLSEQDFYRLWDEMCAKRRRHEPLVYNDEDWGLARVELPECEPTGTPVATS